MSNALQTNVVRFILIIIIQGMILRRVHFPGASVNYIFLILYPILILLLPVRTPRSVLLLIGFGLGLVVDLFYDSLGVHASATVFLAFMRPIILQVFEPRGGYPVNASPTRHQFGLNWFMQYSGFLLVCHLFFYFCVEAFTIDLLPQILLRTLLSFIVSFLIILVYALLFNPKE